MKHNVTDDEVDDIIRRSFERLGLNTIDPIEMQKDFQHLHNWRKSCEQVKDQSLKTAIGVVITGAIGLLLTLFMKFFER